MTTLPVLNHRNVIEKKNKETNMNPLAVYKYTSTNKENNDENKMNMIAVIDHKSEIDTKNECGVNKDEDDTIDMKIPEQLAHQQPSNY